MLTGCSRLLASSCSQVAGSGNVLGGFLAPAWSVPSSIADPTLRSFTFSLINARSRPVKLKLMEPSAAAMYHPRSGRVFLCPTGLSLMLDGKSLNVANANHWGGVTSPHTALDDEYERKFDLGPAGFMSGVSGEFFACAEIEVFTMQTQV